MLHVNPGAAHKGQATLITLSKGKKPSVRFIN